MENITTGTLGAGASTELLGATGIDITLEDDVSFILHNTGVTNAIGTLAVYWSNDPTGTLWSVADADVVAGFSSIAQSSSFGFERRGVVRRRMRIVVTSASGTTYALHVMGRRASRLA